jgi:hypothetical protein
LGPGWRLGGGIEVGNGLFGDEGCRLLEALAGCLEDELSAVGADAVLHDLVEGVLEQDDEGVEVAGKDVLQHPAELDVALLDAGVFFVSTAEAAAATGELGAGVAIGQDPGAKGR